MNIAGVVVLYNPELDVIDNIESYYQYLDFLIIVDNSENINEGIYSLLKEKFKKIKIISNFENKGIAFALNQGFSFCSEQNIDFVLTMDQDSSFKNDDFFRYLNIIELDKDKDIGLYCTALNKKNLNNLEFSYPLVAITSGNIVPISSWKIVNGFEDKLFIDAVDYDFCLKLQLNKLKIKQVCNIILLHNLGEIKIVDFIFFKLKFNAHSDIRHYYMVRNAFYYWSKYFKYFPMFIFKEIILSTKNILEIIFVSKNKKSSLKMIIKGFCDFVNKRYGKINE